VNSLSTRDQIKKAKKGDEKAFQQLIQEEKNKLFRIAYLYVKNENDALDIVQETVYKAFISIKQLKEPNYFSTWLTRILINCAVDFIRKNKNIIPFAEVEDTSEERQPIEEKLDLVEAIRKLENPYKTVIILRYYKDLTIKQIADLLNCPEGTVKTNIHRAISKLKLDLKEECIK
jgi:RNA polymerase sigma-70 factor (ECF subfamily)